MGSRIYVCHTFYHVYVTFLKEFALPKEKQGEATLVLSNMSTEFFDLKDRIRALDYFKEVIEFDEQRAENFPELAKYRTPSKNGVMALWKRFLFTKKFGKIDSEYIPVDFRKYEERYVFCDSDPIGYYLNYKHIPYHALEDGLNTLVQFNAARYDNRGNFEVKAFMSSKLNLIFIQNGYGKYCIDMEVNDISKIEYPCEKFVEVPRQNLIQRLQQDEKDILLRAFVKDMDKIVTDLRSGENHDNKVLILTEPLCDLGTRERIFHDIIDTYGKNAQVILKPHPRDELDYKTLFPEYTMIEKTVPMEMLGFMKDIVFEKVISVFTPLEGITFAKEKIRLGNDFMDLYEAPEIHRQNEKIK